MTQLKQCKRCGLEKELDAFSRAKGKTFDRASQCRQCRKEVYEEQKRAGKIIRGGVVIGFVQPRDCPHCGKNFTPKWNWQKFCTQRCARRAGRKNRAPRKHQRKRFTRTCETCGKTFRAWSAASRFCSTTCSYGRSLGMRSLDGQGYIRVRVPIGTPGAYKNGWIPEHRHVMQQHLGRTLNPSETIHHINGDKTDNRIENLQLRQGKHGTNQQFMCADCGSHNVVPVPL